ncbi:MAG TPA: ABC transporter permease subunit [Terriglobia bacterium]|jgi:ABC-2 type transport system permease protein|nr:ABC transporter permease subunit [Terriglobia bacterium]
MRNILAVAGKELRAYFHSPIAYLVMALFAVLCGFFFYNYTAAFVVQTFRMMATGQMAPNVSINEYIIRPLYEGVLTVVLLLLIPLVTMRLFAEEKRSGTIELLLTSPLTDLQIILGKFLGALALYGVLMLLSFLYIGLLFLYGNPNAKPLLADVLGLFLFGGALLSLGMWISTLTKNQIIAGVVAFALFLLLYVFDWVNSYSSSDAGRVMSYMALTTHFDNFAKGVIDSSDVVYYLSVIVVGIFLTARSVEALKGKP